jgi:hypothetical protein
MSLDVARGPVHRYVSTTLLAMFVAITMELGLAEGLFFLGIRSETHAAETQGKAAEAGKPGIEHIDLIHFSHTDIGFTDHPTVCRELQRRYLDIAIDAVLATRERPASGRFYWTAEGTVAVDEWWQRATAARRDDFLKAIDSGQLDVSALAMNNTPFMDAREWQKMVHWLPEELWNRVQPKVALQNDVNGFPRAGALALLDRGIHRLFTGINEDSGGAPFQRPMAFWWKMPDGRRMFVYLSYSYPTGYWFFEPVEWRHGPVPRAGDTRYRPPRAGDFMGSDEASVRKAHAHLVNRIHSLEAEGYRHKVLLLSITNQWRIDNDPPFPPLADFVTTWNRLELKPTLRLTTASVAMKRLEDEIGGQIPEHQGEWTDWWANGTASAPREVAASRLAKRTIQAAESPIWGEMNVGGRQTVDELVRDLCFFDEHTWGSSNSVAIPYGLDTQSQFNEKASLAFRPMVRAEWLLAQRVRSRLAAEPEGLYVANSAPLPWSGWVRMPASVLRDDYRTLEDASSGKRTKLYFEHGFRPFSPPQNPGELTVENTAATFPDYCERQAVKFWVESLPGQNVRKLQLSKKDSEDVPSSTGARPTVTVDAQGWPTGIVWPDMTKPLFLPGMGDFVAVKAKGLAPRWAAMGISGADRQQREKGRRDVLEESKAAAKQNAAVEDDPHTVVYTQSLEHPRLRWATRRLEVWKGEPRARLTLRFDRISSEGPEALFVVFPLPCESIAPQTSCGGVPFVPFKDHLPGTCRDYFAIDGWIHYAAPAGHWLWVSRDAPLVTFDAPQVKARRTDAPKDLHRVLAIVFENYWYTNFVGDSHGVMEFQFDLAWRKELPSSVKIEDVARALTAEPQVVINPGLKEDPILIKRLYTP